MHRSGSGFGDQTGGHLRQNCANFKEILTGSMLLSGRGSFADHFEDTECIEVHDFNVNALQRTNLMSRNMAMFLKYTFKMYR